MLDSIRIRLLPTGEGARGKYQRRERGRKGYLFHIYSTSGLVHIDPSFTSTVLLA